MKQLIFCLIFLCSFAQAESCYKEDMPLDKLTQCANQSDANAQFNLGKMYDKGEGVPQDYKKAVEWYLKAAEQGYAKAQTNLGLMYHRGEGVPQDDVLAYMWLNLAATQGDVYAIGKRYLIVKIMTSEQIAKAQKMSSDWLARHPQK